MKARLFILCAAISCQAQTPDTYHPWECCPACYRAWAGGPAADANIFPINVWVQDPKKAWEYKAIGINQYIGLWKGPTEWQLSMLEAAGMPVLADQNETALPSPIVRGWTQMDEPDCAQAAEGGGYDPCILPEVIVERYKALREVDKTRPVYLNLGPAVAYEEYKGRGPVCGRHWEHYPQYADGADILSFDVYPVNYGYPLWLVGKGVDRLRRWTGYRKPVWVWIETMSIRGGPKPSPHQIKAQVWMAIIHGAMGIGYFCHQFKPVAVEHAPLTDPEIAAALKAINEQVTSLAPALHTPSVANGVTVSAPDFDVMLKRYGGATWLFAMSARPGAEGPVEFKLRDCGDLQVEVLGEGRTIELKQGAFTDRFSEYGVHIYRLPFDPNADPAAEGAAQPPEGAQSYPRGRRR